MKNIRFATGGRDIDTSVIPGVGDTERSLDTIALGGEGHSPSCNVVHLQQGRIADSNGDGSVHSSAPVGRLRVDGISSRASEGRGRGGSGSLARVGESLDDGILELSHGTTDDLEGGPVSTVGNNLVDREGGLRPASLSSKGGSTGSKDHSSESSPDGSLSTHGASLDVAVEGHEFPVRVGSPSSSGGVPGVREGGDGGIGDDSGLSVGDNLLSKEIIQRVEHVAANGDEFVGSAVDKSSTKGQGGHVGGGILVSFVHPVQINGMLSISGRGLFRVLKVTVRLLRSIHEGGRIISKYILACLVCKTRGNAE